MAEECSEVSSQYSKLLDTFKIPPYHAVCSRQGGILEISENADSYFKSYTSDWSKISPYTSYPGSMLSNLIDGIVGKGIPISTIRNRCVHVKIKKTQNFGVLNSSVSPFGADTDVPNSWNRPISFVLLIHEGSISRNFDNYVDLFVKVFQDEVTNNTLCSFCLIIICNSHLFPSKEETSKCSPSSQSSSSSLSPSLTSLYSPSSSSSLQVSFKYPLVENTWLQIKKPTSIKISIYNEHCVFNRWNSPQ